MGAKKRTIILDALDRHPAFLAWKRLFPSSSPPSSIELFRGMDSEAPVFRLRGVTGASSPVIVKRRDMDGDLDGSGLRAEARIYIEILPALSVPAVECFGYLEDPDGASWLFLEDAGDLWYSPGEPAHRFLAIDWMARLHSTPAAVVSDLPDTGPAYFRSVLRKARHGVRLSLEHPALKESSVGPFEMLLDHLDVIEDGWPHVEQACSAGPQTLVHGDFVPKNVRVGGGEVPRLRVVDWEMAGVAPPAADIAMIPGGSPQRRAYFDRLKKVRRDLAWEDVERLYRIGSLFRLLHSVEWKARSFEHPWIERPEVQMLAYQRALQDLLGDEIWTHSFA